MVELQWFGGNDPESGIACHRIDLFDSAGTLLLQKEVLDQTYILLPVLEEGSYTWSVTAINGAGAASSATTPWSFSIDTSLDTIPPGKPVLFYPPNGTVLENDIVPFLWSDTPDEVRVLGYEIEVHRNSEFEKPIGWTIYTTEPRVTIRLPNRFHYWRVRAIDAAGNKGSWSETWLFGVNYTPVNNAPDEGKSHGSKGGSCFGSIPSQFGIPIGVAGILLGLLLLFSGQRKQDWK